MKLRRSIFVSASFALVCGISGCAVDAAPEETSDDSTAQTDPLTRKEAPAFQDLVAQDPTAPSVTLLASGDGWRKMRVKGSLPDEATDQTAAVDEEIIVIDRDDVIDAAPLGAKTKLALHAQARLRKAQPSAIAPPAGTEDDMVTVISKKGMDAAEADQPNAQGAVMWGLCDNQDRTYSRSVSVDKNYDFHKGTESGSFTGNFDMKASFKANASATLHYTKKRQFVGLGCLTYWISFRKAQVQGTATVKADGKVDGKFEKEWHYDRLVANPRILDKWFTAGGIPIHLQVFVPIKVGLDASAKATLKADASVTGNGNFNVTCTSSSCSGTRSATLSYTNGAPPTFEAQARVKATPWVSASLKAEIYDDDSIGASGQVGLKASLPTDLFAYAGNTCGNADNAGPNEFVTATTLDMFAKVDVIASARAFGSNVGSWSWNVMNRHLYFKSFGDGSVLDPIFYDQSVSGNTVTMRGAMRPCWPYTDAVTYRITWSSGQVETFTGSAKSLFSKVHNVPGFGPRVVKLEAISDAQGRQLHGETTHNVWVGRVMVNTLPLALKMR